MKETQFYNLYLTVKGDSKDTILELLKDAANRLSTEEFGDGITDKGNYFFKWEVKT